MRFPDLVVRTVHFDVPVPPQEAADIVVGAWGASAPPRIVHAGDASACLPMANHGPQA